MNCSHDDVGDFEAATDQLVDEICQRLTSLYALLDTSLADRGPPLADIRAHASEIIRRLASPNGSTAALVARTLWPPQPAEQVPVPWWETPLGTLISGVTREPTGSASAAR